jgi:hypothetical protein
LSIVHSVLAVTNRCHKKYAIVIETSINKIEKGLLTP